MSFPSHIEDNVVLNLLDLDAGADELRLTYEVINGAGETIYLINGLFHRRGADGWVVDRNLVYCSVDDNSILHLKKQMIEVPENIDVEYPEVPFATELVADGTFRETLLIRVPVEPRDPYLPQQTVHGAYDVSSLIFTIGYVVDDGSIKKSTAVAQGAQGLVRLAYSDVRQRQRLKSAGPAAVAVSTVAGGDKR